MSTTAAATVSAARQGGRLAVLRERIAAVKSRRAGARRTAGLATLALAVAVAVAAAFLLDWTLALPKGGRAVLLVALAGGLVWAYRRHVRPWLSVRESDLDLALLVEKQQGVDSDFVAALQFETPAAGGWGSGDLRGAVIDYVAEFGRDWQVPEQVANAALGKRLGWLAGICGLLLVGAAIRPDFAKAFINRMALGSMHYPTRTKIESLAIGGKPVDLAAASASVPCQMGRPVTFDVGLGGAVPDTARVTLAGSADGTQATLDLARDKTKFSATLPRLLESVKVQVFAGDAWTEPVLVNVVPLPLVETTLTATPPTYAREGTAAEAVPQATRQLSVLEGSQVDLGVTCTNKSLTSAALVVEGKEYPLQAEAGSGRWSLPAAGSPLAVITQPVRFELRVVDEHGLSPDPAVSGAIRLKPDALPRVSADVRTRLVLPGGTPRVEWTAADDHGIRDVTVIVEPFVRSTGPAKPVEPVRFSAVDVPAAGWLGRDALPLAGAVAIPLDALRLAKGDQVRVTLQATDYRGERAGQTSSSDPIVLDVTDEPGLLASLYESDERSARQLDSIIERQLQVGAVPGGDAARGTPPTPPPSPPANPTGGTP